MTEKEIVEEKLLSFRKNLEREWDHFSPKSEEIEAWKNSFNPEVRNLIKEIDYVKNLMQSPVYVGLLGRYSHGKTALANAIFGIPEDYSLPEGEGIVTPKITKVSFSEELSFPKAFIVKRGNEREEIDIESLRKLAKSSDDLKESSLIDYLDLRLPAQSGFSRLFAQKKISIIDMPGLGGPYFKDAVRTQKYLEDMDFILVVIKITEIDKAGKVIEKFVSNTKIPRTVCVFTFYDKAREFPLFANLDDEDIQQKAIELAKEHIPSLAKELETTSIFVSSKTGLNIEELREFILNFVEKKTEAIAKIREETPEVFKRRFSQIRQELIKVESKIDSFLNKLSSNKSLDIATENRPPIFRKAAREEKKELRNAKKEIKLKLRDARERAESLLTSILDASDYNQVRSILKEIENEIRNILEELELELNNQFNDRIKPVIKDYALRFIERDLDLSPDRKEQLEEDIEREIEDFQIFFDWENELSLTKDLERRYLASKSKDLAKRIAANIKDPTFLMALGGSFVIFVVGQAISHVSLPLIGKFEVIEAVGGVIELLGTIGIVGSIIYAIVMAPGERAHFNKLLRDFYREKKTMIANYFYELEKYLDNIINESVEELKNNVADEIEGETNEVLSDVRKIREMVKRLNKEFYDVKNSIQSFIKAVSIEN